MQRKKNLKDLIIIRDMGICYCCGFQGHEVHHIIPLVYGGEDSPKNMITLCNFCHKFAPDTKEEFIDYANSGGAKTMMLIGKIHAICEKNNYNFIKFYPTIRELIKSMKNIGLINSEEKYFNKSIKLNISSPKL